MSEIYATQIPKAIDKEQLERLEYLICDERRQKIKKFRFVADKKRALFAEVLLRYILEKNYDLKGKQVQFELNKYGKPKLKDYNDIHFNLSHSGSWVVCGISNDIIGVDVEQIGNADLAIARRYFTLNEYENIINRPKEEQTRWFYYLWTLKESYIKAEGKGLSISLNTFGFQIQSNHVEMQFVNGEKSNFFFQTFSLDKTHIGAICTKAIVREKVKVVSYQNMLGL